MDHEAVEDILNDSLALLGEDGGHPSHDDGRLSYGPLVVTVAQKVRPLKEVKSSRARG